MQSTQNMNAQAPVAPVSSAESDAKTNAILAWLFAPISSFLMKDQQDPFVKNHVTESLYFGIFSIVLAVVAGVISMCLGVVFGGLFGFGLAAVISCVEGILWIVVFLVISVPRLVGIIKALNHETWTVPYISAFMSKYIKL